MNKCQHFNEDIKLCWTDTRFCTEVVRGVKLGERYETIRKTNKFQNTFALFLNRHKPGSGAILLSAWGVASERRGQWCVAIMPHEYEYEVTKKQRGEQGGGGILPNKERRERQFYRGMNQEWLCYSHTTAPPLCFHYSNKQEHYKVRNWRVGTEGGKLKSPDVDRIGKLSRFDLFLPCGAPSLSPEPCFGPFLNRPLLPPSASKAGVWAGGSGCCR